MLPKEAFMGSEPPRYRKPDGAKLSPSEKVIAQQSKSADEFFKVSFAPWNLIE